VARGAAATGRPRGVGRAGGGGAPLQAAAGRPRGVAGVAEPGHWGWSPDGRWVTLL